MDALEKYGFIERKDGTSLYRDAKIAVVIFPSKDEKYGIGIHQRRWDGWRLDTSGLVRVVVSQFADVGFAHSGSFAKLAQA